MATRRYISMAPTVLHDDTFDPLRQCQFSQEEPGRVIFKYVPKTPMEPEAIGHIAERLSWKLGPDTVLAMVEVDQISRAPSGKYRFLNQRLLLKHGER